MGTSYQVKVVTGRSGSIEGLAAKVEERLKDINRSMSTYLDDSEISRFNRHAQIEEPFAVSDDFMRVMQAGQHIFELSEGAWDATVGPLVDLWGFGPAEKNHTVPSAAQLQALMASVGYDKIDLQPAGYLAKKIKNVSLDFGSIAKGFGVDQVAALLRLEGHTNFLVEIGGEIVASGFRTDGKPWRVGVNTPRSGVSADAVYKAVSLTNAAFATSGDYRNFFVLNGVRYSHVIDPRSGFPVTNGVVSVSIIAPDCTLADGLATAVMVMGAEKGIALVNRLDRVEGLIIVMLPDGTLVDYFSSGLSGMIN